MWLAPHFMALDVAGASVLLFQKRKGISIYQRQSDPVLDRALRRGRLRLGNAEIFSRDEAGKALMRAIRRGDGFFNLPDMDFGTRDAAFVPFFGVQAATLLAPSRLAKAMNMIVQPVVAEILPGGAGYVVRYEPPWTRLSERRPGRRRGPHEPLDRKRDPAQSGAIPVGPSALQDAPAGGAVAVLSNKVKRRPAAGLECGGCRLPAAAGARIARPDNRDMRLRFTKMQGAGNDFVVLDATRAPLALDAAQLRRIGDRRFGVGCDQILIVEPSTTPGVDFRYRIFNGASGEEVEQCGNGARCFVRFVRERGLTSKTTIVVDTLNRRLELREQADGRVTVDMGAPDFEPLHVPFDTTWLAPRSVESGLPLWPVELGEGRSVTVAVVSMGNPHAVQLVADVDAAPVATQGPLLERHARFARGVNAGFMQVVARDAIRLRVFERGAGETLACGTGACAAVAVGIRLGLLDAKVDVETRGGRLTIEWAGEGAPVLMTGPAQTVFEGEIEL